MKAISSSVVAVTRTFLWKCRCLLVITGREPRETATDPEFDLVAVVVRRRLRFAGHILRMDPDRLLRRTFVAYSNATDTRPTGSLLYGLDSMTFEEIVAMAENRSDWSQHIILTSDIFSAEVA